MKVIILLTTMIVLIQESENKQFQLRPPMHHEPVVLQPPLEIVPDDGVIQFKEDLAVNRELSYGEPDGPKNENVEEITVSSDNSKDWYELRNGEELAKVTEGIVENEYYVDDNETYISNNGSMNNDTVKIKDTAKVVMPSEGEDEWAVRVAGEDIELARYPILAFPPPHRRRMNPTDLGMGGLILPLKDKDAQIKYFDEAQLDYNEETNNDDVEYGPLPTFRSPTSTTDMLDGMSLSNIVDGTHFKKQMSISWFSLDHFSLPKVTRTLGPGGYVSYSSVPIVSGKRGKHKNRYYLKPLHPV